MGNLWRVGRRGLAVVLVIVSVMLTSCTDYQVRVRFDHSNHAELVQTIQWERSQTEATPWPTWVSHLAAITRTAHGRVKAKTESSLELTVPLANGMAFVQTLEQIQAAIAAALLPPGGPEERSPAQLQLRQLNRVVAVHYTLTYDLDLTALGISSPTGQLLFSPGSLLNLGLQLEAPWGFQVQPTTHPTPIWTGDRSLTWQPQLGQVNHLELDFWLPNPIGWGAIIILGVVGLGLALRSWRDRHN